MDDFCEIHTDDIVNVLEDDGTLTIATATSEPWRLGDGTWVIKLDDRRGGYLLKRVSLNRRGRI